MDKTKCLISIIIAVYNSEKTILRAIKSILNQSYKNIELIVIDDGSTDNTLEEINKIEDSRIIVASQKNLGPGAARNYGIKLAKGDFIAFCDADDKLNENIIEEFVKLIKDKYYDVVLYKMVRVDEKNNIISTPNIESFEIKANEINVLIKSIYNKFYKYNKILGFDGTGGKFVSRKLLKDNNIFFQERMYRSEDAYFCKKIYEHANSIYYLNAIGYYYFENNESLCNKFNKNIVDIHCKALSVLGEGLYNDNDFYVRCITTLTECEKLYFLNKQYKKSYMELKKEYYEMLEREYYKNALNKIDLKTVPIHYKIEIILLRNRFFLIYIMFKKIYLGMKNRR